MIDNPERNNRLLKLAKLTEAGVHPHPERFERSHVVTELLSSAIGTQVTTAGRIVRMREMGKITFAHIQDTGGRIQLIFQRDKLGEDAYKRFIKCSDLGDWCGVSGEIFITKTGEQSVLVTSWTFLGKALLPLPAKFHGIKDTEVLYRQRYLDLIANDDSRARFVFRSAFIRAIRQFYWNQGFMEVETATLLHHATGAAARPYHTHNNALDIDIVLRISHELPLKELVVGGLEKIFELGKAFRNEGQDPSHLPEHTHLEHYAAFWSFEDNIKLTEQMIEFLFAELKLPWVLDIKDRAGVTQQVNFKPPFTRLNYIERVSADSGLDLMNYVDAVTLRRDIKAKGIDIEGLDEMSLGTLIDHLYKKVTRPKIIQPTILVGYPKVLQPLARVNDADPRFVDQFQAVVNGWEIVKAYSELVDPIDQRARFDEQSNAKAAGDNEAMEVDENYLVAMEHGMPPISGWGMGIDRVVALLTGQDNLRDIVLFPLVKPGRAGAAQATGDAEQPENSSGPI